VSNDIVVAAIAFMGTFIGTIGGIITTSKLTCYRIEQLEKKVDKHNNFASRMPLVEKDIENINDRLDDLEK